jgi:hypothetical protein
MEKKMAIVEVERERERERGGVRKEVSEGANDRK